MSEAKVLSSDDAEIAARKVAIFQTHVAVQKHPDLLPNAALRVHFTRPELQTRSVEVHFSTTTQDGMPLIEISGRSSDPVYLAAYITETAGEFIGIINQAKDREEWESPRNQALMSGAKLIQQRAGDLEVLKAQLKRSADDGAPTAILSNLQADIEEQEKWIKWAREIISYLVRFDGISEPEYGILEIQKPEPLKHGMDPYSLAIHHPWRALVSLASHGLWRSSCCLFVAPTHQRAPCSGKRKRKSFAGPCAIGGFTALMHTGGITILTPLRSSLPTSNPRHKAQALPQVQVFSPFAPLPSFATRSFSAKTEVFA